MPKPLKVRRSHEIVGLFVLLALGIALAALLLGPQTQRWFTASQNLAIHLPPEGSLGLREGGDVQILGSVVGTVENIVATDAGKVEAVVSIRGNFFRFVRQDSQAIIRRPLGIGEASIEITRGHGAPLPARGGFLDAVADKGPTEFKGETLAAIRDEALPAIKELRGALSQYSLLAAELRSDKGQAQQALRHLNRLGEALTRGEGLVGSLLVDPRPAAELRAALPKINAALDELNATLRDARALSERLPQVGADLAASMKNLRTSSEDGRRLMAAMPELQRSIGQVTDTAPAVLLQTQETLRQIQRLTEALQAHWLIRGSMNAAEPPARLDTDRVGTQR